MKNKKSHETKSMGNWFKTARNWIVAIVIVVFALRILDGSGEEKVLQISFSQFNELLTHTGISILNADIIEKENGHLQFNGEVGDYSSLNQLESLKNEAPTKYFSVNLPFIDRKMIENWDSIGFNYTFQNHKFSWGDIIIYLLPWAVIALIALLVLRQQKLGYQQFNSLRKCNFEFIAAGKIDKKFADIAGIDEIKKELANSIAFLKSPNKYLEAGASLSKGILLKGAIGTGKTLLALCIAGEAGLPLFKMNGSDFIELYTGIGASRMRDLFKTARKHAPCIVFIDDIDTIAEQRDSNYTSGNNERIQTLAALLHEMDGIDDNVGILVVVASNRPEVLDSALLRPGRFDRTVTLQIPNCNEREAILLLQSKKMNFSSDVSLFDLAERTNGFTGADLNELMNVSIVNAVYHNRTSVSLSDFEDTIKKIRFRRNMILSPEQSNAHSI